MNKSLKKIEPEYVYVTIPAEYVCVYHRILAMLADYGEDMLKDCKASCKDRNSGVIECFNMFNSAVACRRLSDGDKESKYGKLAETLIKYIKAKINQIYKGHDNSTSFVFPVDKNGELKAFVSCGERPEFHISLEDGALYEKHLNNGFAEHFSLGPEDDSPTECLISNDNPSLKGGLFVTFIPTYKEITDDLVVPSGRLVITKDGVEINEENCTISRYFDNSPVSDFENITELTPGYHRFRVVVTYEDETKMTDNYLKYKPKTITQNETTGG